MCQVVCRDGRRACPEDVREACFSMIVTSRPLWRATGVDGMVISGGRELHGRGNQSWVGDFSKHVPGILSGLVRLQGFDPATT